MSATNSYSNSTLVFEQTLQSGRTTNINWADFSYVTDDSVKDYDFLVVQVSVTGAVNASYQDMPSYKVIKGEYLQLGRSTAQKEPGGDARKKSL